MKGSITHNSHAYVHGVAMCVGWQDESVNLSELIFRTVRTALDDSGLDVDSLPGRWMEADANCLAPDADQLVLTGFRNPSPSAMPVVGGDSDE